MMANREIEILIEPINKKYKKNINVPDNISVCSYCENLYYLRYREPFSWGEEHWDKGCKTWFIWILKAC